MTDWELITEQIQCAMRAADKASEAGEPVPYRTTKRYKSEQLKDEQSNLVYSIQWKDTT